ncbi:MAG: hypothetical protein L0271_05970 [Gemmatimonadetes bacterium]|nr:hypothetical protein [Gemmatimonadota bacterium]
MTDVIAKEELFKRLGYGGSHDELDRVLQEAGLSRTTKRNVAVAKADEIAAVLAAHFIIVCSRGDCRATVAEASDVRSVLPAASQEDCVVCGGSANARAVDAMIEAMNDAGSARLCVVGGSPAAREELDRLVAKRLAVRLIDGAISRTARAAKADLRWADVVVVWGSTILGHKVSRLYKGSNVIQLARRSIQELAREVTRSVREANHRNR